MQHVKSFFMESFIKELEKAKCELTKLLKRHDIEFCFIGGVARNEYNEPTITEDIDILVRRRDRPKMADLPIGYITDVSSGRAKAFSLHNPKTRVVVLYSGEHAGDGNGIEFKDPKSISKGNMITLENFVMYKVSSGIHGSRLKDLADVQYSIKKYGLPKSYARDNNWQAEVAEEYEEVWENYR